MVNILAAPPPRPGLWTAGRVGSAPPQTPPGLATAPTDGVLVPELPARPPAIPDDPGTVPVPAAPSRWGTPHAEAQLTAEQASQDATPTARETAQARAVLAVIGAAKQDSFLDHARDAASASQVGARVTLADAAAGEQNRCALARRRLKDLGGDPLADIAAVMRIASPFDTGPHGDWWRQMLATFLSHGAVTNLVRMLSAAVAPAFANHFDGLVGDCAAAAYQRACLREAIESDPDLARRLASTAQKVAEAIADTFARLIAGNTDLAELVAKVWPGDPERRILAQLSASHLVRVRELGLAVPPSSM